MPTPNLKERIKELEDLMNRLSSLIYQFEFGENQQDVAEMWGKVKDKHERLFLLNQSIEIQEDNLKNGSITDQITKEIVTERLERDIVDAKNQLKTVPSLIKKAEAKYDEMKAVLKESASSKKAVKETVKEEKPVEAIRSNAVVDKPRPKKVVSAKVEDFEKKHLSNLAKKEVEIKRIYEQSIHEISIGYSQIEFNGQVFKLSDYPALKNRIDIVIKRMHAKIQTAVVNGIEESWYLSFEKNNVLVGKRLRGKEPSAKGMQMLYDPNRGALNEFLKRKNKGLNLSDRVWNSLENYKTEMETALGVGVSEGRSAAAMATDLKKYLKEPDRLFRRVRQADGTLKLSQAAKNYHPGQGVYRSSYQNALRVTASETNMAYRTADYERWLKLPFVIGIDIVLSKNHPEYDICDSLVGRYPKTYLHRGFHPRCLCYAVAVQVSDEGYEKMEDDILAGRQPKAAQQILDIPERAKQWLEKNAERISNWNSKPYFVADNKKIIGKFLQ